MFRQVNKQLCGIRAHDALIFGDQLAGEVKEILRMPASVGFWFHEPAYWSLTGLPAEKHSVLKQPRDEKGILVSDSMLALTLSESNAISKLDVVIYDLDPELLKKMDQEWLVELQVSLIGRFESVRHKYTDPLTGLYNQRALDLILQEESCWKSMYLIATVSRLRSIAASFQKVVQLSSLLEATIRDPLFYFGQGVFGHVSLQCDRKSTLSFSHRLITCLKREKLRRVHIGFACLFSETTAETAYADCWQALLSAEQRGPYSLCDAASLHTFEDHPLTLPKRQILFALQRLWRNFSRFGLVLLDGNGGNSDLAALSLLFPEKSLSLDLSTGMTCIVIPEVSSHELGQTVQAATQMMSDKGYELPAIGYCQWPSNAASKIDCLRNCRKALLHGSFYGTSAVVEFDALSLNVSGDFYFDEGDYKKAICDYRAGLALHPGDINLLNSLGVSLAEVDRHRQALECFCQVLKEQPDNYMALVNKGMSCRQVGQEKPALQCFEQALQSKECPTSGNLDLYLQLAKLYCIYEKFSQAVLLLGKWTKANTAPQEFMYFKLLGEAYLGMQRHSEAVDALQASLRLHPQNADSLSMLGLLYVLEGEGVDVGLSLCDKAIAMDGMDYIFHYRRALALYHADQDADALLSVRFVLKKKRTFASAVFLRGLIYERLGWLKKATQSYERLLGLKTVQKGYVKKARARLKKLTG